MDHPICLVEVLSSKHSSVVKGMIGKGVFKDGGWEVTFEKFRHHAIANEAATEKETVVWFKPDEIRVIA